MSAASQGMRAAFLFFITMNTNGDIGTMKRFMLVEDNKRFREIMKQFLAPFGSVVSETESGLNAVLMYDSVQPDMVFMDIHIDGMGGISATRIIKKYHPSARIVIVSECDEQDFTPRALEAGAIGFVPKDHLERLGAFFSDH